MVQEYYNMFWDIQTPEKRYALDQLKDAYGILIELLYEDPEIIEDEEFYEDLQRSFAVKEALERRNCFYNA